MVSMTERFEMRLDQETLITVDRWRSEQVDVPSRAEAMRRLIELGLTRTSVETVKISDGERLILIMLRDVYKHLKIGKSEIDPDFIADIIFGGHFWALKWELTGLFHGEEDKIQNVHLVVDVLGLWDMLEYSYDKFSKKDRERIEKEAEPFGKHVRFEGFDGNNEAEHLGIARFLIEKMDRFERFKGRDLNSHMPSIEMYRRMLSVYLPMRSNLMGRGLTTDDVVKILQAQAHSSNERLLK